MRNGGRTNRRRHRRPVSVSNAMLMMPPLNSFPAANALLTKVDAEWCCDVELIEADIGMVGADDESMER